MPKLFCELDRSTADPDRAVILAAELVVWWRQAGRIYYGRDRVDHDAGLRSFVNDAVETLGGWRAARRTICSASGTGTI